MRISDWSSDVCSSDLTARLDEAMRYACLGGGKRFRPFLTVACGDLFGVPRPRRLRAAAAIEMLHGYSLVHDDLPCMDDDDLHRGQPTVHRPFDEATAVLARAVLELGRAYGRERVCQNVLMTGIEVSLKN